MAELTIHIPLRTCGFPIVDRATDLSGTWLADQRGYRVSGVKARVGVGRVVCCNCNDRAGVEQWFQRLVQSLQKVPLGQRLAVMGADIRRLDMHEDQIMIPQRSSHRRDLGM